ncbi:MAG: metallophosphoesterase [Anaerolineales bacterium]|nr:metallophosphoesterase [Anaerolineales bacterium]
MARTLVIGDIHGCYAELLTLIEAAQLTDADQIVAVGDLVDRGPDSPAVYRYFRDNPRAFSLMGNHERKHVRAARGELSLARSQLLCRRQFQAQGEDYEAAVAWMAKLPLYLELPEAIIVHGFVEEDIPLAAQLPTVLCGTMGGTNYLRQTGRWPWFKFARQTKPILMGHLNYTRSSQPFIYKKQVFGLDTGCVEGKALTGLLLPEFRWIQVLAARNYWGELAQTL